MKDFVHLHVHTEYSLLDGAARIKKLVKTCKEYGMKSVAITDHGNMYGTVLFYKECKKAGIKPIIGCEFYVADDLYAKNGKSKNAHLVLLAKNEQGYKNIAKLNTIAFVDGFYYKPRIDYKTLAEHTEGVVCLSACLAGDIPSLLLDGRRDEAEKLTEWFKEKFGDDFYIELQNHQLEEQIVVNKGLKELAVKFGVATVATNDVHYIYKQDAEMQDILMCVQMAKTVDDPDRLKFPNDEFYLKTYDEMAEAFPNDLDALERTNEIADKCNFNYEFGHYLFPKFDVPEGYDALSYIKKLINDGLQRRYGEITQDKLDRIEIELGVIHKQGFVEYFLTVWDYIDAARKKGISVGPGRGSGAGSLVAYALGITDIDPLKYNLLFERFLHSERVSAPDFDIDFADDRRDEIIEYVKEKYGEDRVIKIITFGTMAAKNALKDVARVLRVPYSMIDKATKAIPNGIKRPNVIGKVFGLSKKEGAPDESIPELVQMYQENDEIRKVVDIASKLEDSPRQTGTHACGVIIGADVLHNSVPLSRNGEDVTTQFEGVTMEELGHLKFDFLGLRNLNDIQKTLQYIEQRTGKKIDFEDSNYDDPEVYKLIATGNTKAIFQIESSGFQKFMRELKPTGIEDIIAGVSLYRPGPMDSIPRYVHNKHNPKDVTYAHPILKDILNVTYGCIVYQEQVMRIVQDMAGYTLGQADMVRRIMSKKKHEDMAKEKTVFLYGKPSENGKPAIDGAIKKGIPEDVAIQIWSEMETFASYAFNKSHAAAYSMITYQTAWLKTYYETEFLTAVLNNRITNAEEIKNYVTYAKQEKIEVLPPDINKSFTYFTVAGDKQIRFGLAALKNVGVSVIDGIVQEREDHGDYKDLTDFINRLDGSMINKRCIESLILSGAFDKLGKKRRQMMEVYSQIVERSIADRKTRESGQMTLFDTVLKNDNINEIAYPNVPEYDEQTKLKLEKEIVGVYISGHPLSNYIDKFKEFTLTSDMLGEPSTEEENRDSSYNDENQVEEVTDIKDGTEVICGGLLVECKKVISRRTNKEMAVGKVEDLFGTIDLMFFPQIYTQYKNILKEDSLYTVKGKVSIRGGERPSVLVDTIESWENKGVEQTTREKRLYLRYNLQNKSLSANIDKILKTYPGDTEVVIKCAESSKIYKLNTTIKPSSFLINELYAFLSDEDIKLM